MESLIYSTDRELTDLKLEELVDSRFPILGRKLQQEMTTQELTQRSEGRLASLISNWEAKKTSIDNTKLDKTKKFISMELGMGKLMGSTRIVLELL